MGFEQNYIPELSREDIPQALRGQRNVIFGNIEKIYGFHHHYFLRELERCHNLPFLVGQCFLRHEQHFYLYALYNKNKPKSDALMAEYGTAFFRVSRDAICWPPGETRGAIFEPQPCSSSSCRPGTAAS